MTRLVRGPLRLGAVGVVVGVAAPATATVIAVAADASGVSAASLSMLAVVAAAWIGGVLSGLIASLLSAAALDFWFTPPLHEFRVDKIEDLIALGVFLIVGSIVGSLLARALEERARATRRERETRLLDYFATKLLSGERLDRVLNDFAAALLEPFALASCEIDASFDGTSLEARSVRPGAEAGSTTVVPLVAGNVPFGTLTSVRRADAGAMSAGDRALLEACARQAAVAIERERMATRAEGSRLQAETNQLRAALFSAVTHDLRTPLASIKASVTSLLDASVVHDDRQERELLQTVEEEADRLNRLVGNILDLAKVRAGALVPAKQPTAIDEVIESVLHRMRRSLDGLDVRTVFRGEIPEIEADPVQIDQVVSNVLENAARFSPPGGEVSIAVGAWRSGVQVRVSDHGPGVPEEDRVRVFEPFFRRDAGQGRSGSGLGLAIARAIVLAHGGRIWIEGAPTGGTAVVFELPQDAGPIPQEPVA